MDESEVRILLAVGSMVFLVVSTNTALTARLPRKHDRGVSALLMGVILVPVLNLTLSIWFTLNLFCAMATFAVTALSPAVRWDLAQPPGRPGAMMSPRTASAQLGS